MTIAGRLGLPAGTPRSLQIAIGCYMGHILFQGWIASSEIFLLAALVYGLAALWRGEMRASFHILYLPLILFAAASSISALVAPRNIHLWAESATWGKFAAFAFAVMLFREVPRARKLALNCFLVFGFFIAAYGLTQYFFLARRDLEHRITGPAAHVMTYSGLLLPISLLFLILALDSRKPILIAGTILTTLSIVLTFTRSVWVGWAAAVLLLFVLRKPRALIVAAPLLLLFLLLSPLSVFSRVMSTFDTNQSSNLDRIRMFEAGEEIIRDYPIWGVGPANIKEVYPLYRKHDAPRFRIPHLHNNIVQIWAERGIAALAAYLLLLALFLRECARGWRSGERIWADIGVAVAVSLTCAGLFEFNFGDTEVLLTLLDLFALVAISIEAGRQSSPGETTTGETSPA